MQPWRTRLTLAAVLALWAAAATGCSQEPRIDGTSEQTIEQSVEQIADRMSEEDAETFRNAVDVLVMQEMARALEDEADLSPEQRTDRMNERLRERLHDRTANDVIDQVMEIHERRAAEETG